MKKILEHRPLSYRSTPVVKVKTPKPKTVLEEWVNVFVVLSVFAVLGMIGFVTLFHVLAFMLNERARMGWW